MSANTGLRYQPNLQCPVAMCLSRSGLHYTVKTEACCAHCWCVHRDKFVATRFSFYMIPSSSGLLVVLVVLQEDFHAKDYDLLQENIEDVLKYLDCASTHVFECE